jgi:2-polyprenyl-3-methyl-5-hydroxy-6-metoxy-1,4-benzoquinol methylase
MEGLLGLSLTFLVPSYKDHNCIRTAPYHPAIHNFGNHGLLGRIHATCAQFATELIDRKAYDGRVMRRELAELLSSRRSEAHDVRLVEVGCGVGTLTEHLVRVPGFSVHAVDTSREMLRVARTRVSNATFELLNGADVGSLQVDVSVASMVMHELPKNAHEELLRSMAECVRGSSGEVWIVDIDPGYQPSWMMLSGEPYVTAYLEEFDDTVHRVSDALGWACTSFPLIEGRVRGWVLRPDQTSSPLSKLQWSPDLKEYRSTRVCLEGPSSTPS